MKKLFIALFVLLLFSTSVYAIEVTRHEAGLGSAGVSDESYNAITWNGISNTAPSKNAIRDKIETLGGTYITQTITNGVTTTAPSEDAVYDALVLKAPIASPTFTGIVTLPKTINSSSAVSCVATVCTDVAASYAIYITSTGTDVLTIADGTTAGQEKYVSHKVDGGSVTITPTSFSGGTSVTLSNAGDDALFHWNGAKWDLVVTYGGVIDGAGGGGSGGSIDTIYIDASAMIPSTTNGALQGTTEYGTNDIDIDYFAFDAGATEERVQFKCKMSENWDLGTVKVKFDWTSATNSTAGDTVEWGVKAGALSNNDTIDAALGTAQVITDTLLANNGTKLQVTSATPAITIGGTPALGDMIVFEVYRNTDGTDDMAEDAWLTGITIQYTKSGSVVAW